MTLERKLIEQQKWLYHISSLENLESILTQGLLSRSNLRLNERTFNDVADPEIIEGRSHTGLDQYVPFHFFPNNPFDGRVQSTYRDAPFFYICVARATAQKNRYLIIAKHPLSREMPKYLSYQDGFSSIDWQKMNTRDYKDQETKLICMAECISPQAVPASDFVKLVFKSAEHERYAIATAKKLGIKIDTWINPNFFFRHSQ